MEKITTKEEALEEIKRWKDDFGIREQPKLNFHLIPQDADTIEFFRDSPFHQYMFKEELI